MSQKLTPEQSRAANPKASAWVEASAGTGKTHVLTARMLNLLLSGTAPDRILALTFTKAAAAEMANRILDRLGAWAIMDPAILVAEIEALSGTRPSKEDVQRARKLFARVLDLPQGLNIQTIHAFCQSLLGRFPVESGLPPQFKVMDERTQDEILSATRDDLMANVKSHEGSPLNAALALVVTLAGESQFNALMAALIRERVLLSRLRPLGNEGVTSAIKHVLGLPLEESAADVVKAACKNANEQALQRAVQALVTGTKTDVARGERIANWLAFDEDVRIETFNDYCRAFLTGDGKPFARLATKKPCEADPQLLDILFEEAQRLEMAQQRLALIEFATRSSALLQVGLALSQGFDATKQRLGLADYDDLIAKTAELLTERDMAAWVLYKLDGGIDHILIDEAQDTNPEQWQVIQALTGDFFAGEGAKPQERSIFAVGDVKQSIYGFQRAAPRLFDHYQTHFTRAVKQAGQIFETVPLDLSFRSTDAVLGLVDAVFDGDAAKGLSFSERQIKHRPHRNGHAGRVELWPTIKPTPGEEPDVWEPPIEAISGEDPQAVLANKIADTIAHWIDKEPLPARDRTIQAGDIMVLVRRRTAFVDLLVRALKARQVAVAGIDRFDLLSPIAVEDLLALLQFAVLPEDDLNLACVLKGPFIGVDEETLFELSHKRRHNLWRTLREKAKNNERLERARRFLTDILARADFTPPFEFLEYILNERGGRRSLLARLGREAEEAIDELLNQALNFEINHCPSLDGFLHWIHAHASEVKRDAEQTGNAVRIMTVHGSKGLQAPVVFLPDSCQMPKDDAPLLKLETQDGREIPLWYKRKTDAIGPVGEAKAQREAETLAETKRLLYVALTRAEDRLIVTGWENTRGRSEGCWYDMVSDGFDRLDAYEQDDIRIIETSQRTKAQKDRQAKKTFSPPPLPKWAEKPAPIEATPPRPLAPSLEDAGPAALSPLAQGEGDVYRRGRLIHKLLERLPDMPVEQRETHARAYLEKAAGDFGEAWRRALIADVMRLLNDPKFSDIFSPEALAEAPLTGLIGDRVIMGQVDRLLISDDRVVFVDYKTNRSAPLDIHEIPKAYLKQMAAYHAVLSRIYKNARVEGVLLWTSSLTAHLLNEKSLRPYMPKGV
ncbi:MAG: double-strand break repair helicase AddA [Sphingomonadales bacterium]|jgi:ATP-dependent helicase/nuclease subunit A